MKYKHLKQALLFKVGSVNIKKDMKTICQESSLNWNVDFDASQNIVYCYVIPGRKVREIRSIK